MNGAPMGKKKMSLSGSFWDPCIWGEPPALLRTCRGKPESGVLREQMPEAGAGVPAHPSCFL